MWRTIRWLDRCIEHHQQSGKDGVQNLFAIVQGGLDAKLRDQCLDEMIARKDRVTGYAIGGLSGGEAKGTLSSSSAVIVVIYSLCRCILEGVSPISNSPSSRLRHSV